MECSQLHQSSLDHRWLIDSGATSHMTHSRELLVNYRELEKPERVSFGDGCIVEAIATGDV